MNVTNVVVVDWEVKGEYHEDTYYPSFAYHVLADFADGSRLAHEVTFVDDPEGAERLAARVEAAGEADPEHWDFHDFFSRSLENRLDMEAMHEDFHRRGYGELVPDHLWATGD